jgi:hypothetical protein
MAQVGGVRIPFIVDTTDIPRAVRDMEKELRRAKQVASEVHIRIDGRHVRKLTTDAIIPLMTNLEEVRSKALQVATSLKQIGTAARTLQAGKNISDKFVHSLSLLAEVGPETVESIRKFNKLNTELFKLRSEAKTATTRMQILGKAMQELGGRQPLGRKRIDQLMQFANTKSLRQIEKYRQAVMKLQEAEARSGKDKASAREMKTLQKEANIERQKMIKLLDNQYRKQKRMATLAAKEHEPALLEKVNTARARAIRLLEKDASITKRQLDTLKQRMVLETSPRVGYARV